MEVKNVVVVYCEQLFLMSYRHNSRVQLIMLVYEGAVLWRIWHWSASTVTLH